MKTITAEFTTVAQATEAQRKAAFECHGALHTFITRDERKLTVYARDSEREFWTDWLAERLAEAECDLGFCDDKGLV